MSSPEPNTDTVQEPCPTPLSWRQVLEIYLTETQPWTAELGHWTIHGRSWGTGQPIYFVPDLVCESDGFALLGYLLREQFRCVFLDWPGVQQGPTSGWQAEELAALIVAAADQNGDNEISLVGSGFGCLPILTLMRDFPERLEAAILMGGFAQRRLSRLERILTWFGRQSRRQLAQIPGRVRIMENNYRRWFPPFDQSRWEYFLWRHGNRTVGQIARLTAAIRQFDVRDHVESLSTPTLLLRTEGEGRMAAQGSEWLASRLPICQQEWLHTTGPLAHLTHPHRVSKLVREFLSGENPDDSGIA